MKMLGALVFALSAVPAAAGAAPVEGRLQEVESRFTESMARQIEAMDRLRSDARRRNDSLAAGCVEQKLVPAQNLRSAAAKSAARLRALPPSDIEALNGEVRNLSTAADRIGELSYQARACLQINSGQVVTSLQLTPDAEFDPAKNAPPEQLADVIVPRRPNITPFD